MANDFVFFKTGDGERYLVNIKHITSCVLDGDDLVVNVRGGDELRLRFDFEGDDARKIFESIANAVGCGT